jgi:hypothetical protein
MLKWVELGLVVVLVVVGAAFVTYGMSINDWVAIAGGLGCLLTSYGFMWMGFGKAAGDEGY